MFSLHVQGYVSYNENKNLLLSTCLQPCFDMVNQRHEYLSNFQPAGLLRKLQGQGEKKNVVFLTT